MYIPDLNPIPYWMNTLHRYYTRTLSLIELITLPIFAILNYLRWNRECRECDDKEDKSYSIQESPSVTEVVKKILPDSPNSSGEPNIQSPAESEDELTEERSVEETEELPLIEEVEEIPLVEEFEVIQQVEEKEKFVKSIEEEKSPPLSVPTPAPIISKPIETIKPQDVMETETIEETEATEDTENQTKLRTFFTNLRMTKTPQLVNSPEITQKSATITISLAPIEALLTLLEKKVILKVKKVKSGKKQGNETQKFVISVKEGKECKIKGNVLQVLENSVNLLPHLSITQITHLKNNLLFIKDLLTDEEQPRLMTIMKALYAQRTALWVAYDFEQGKLEEKCLELGSFVIKGMKKGEGRSGAGCERLFRYTSSISDQQMEEWRYNHFAVTDKFTVYDWNKFLNQYIAKFPKEKVEVFQPFQKVSSVSDTIDAMASLPPADQVLVTCWLRMFKVALENIWIKEDLELPKNKNLKREEIMEGSAKAMLAACPTICRFLAPEKIHETHATINTQFLVEILVKHMGE